MTNPESEQAAFPMVGTENNYQADGLTKREYFAAHAPQMTDQWFEDRPKGEHWLTSQAKWANAYAKVLIEVTAHPEQEKMGQPSLMDDIGSKAFSAKGGEPDRENLRTIGHGHVDSAQTAMIAALAEGRNCLEIDYSNGTFYSCGMTEGADAMLRVAVKCAQEGFAGILEDQGARKGRITPS